MSAVQEELSLAEKCAQHVVLSERVQALLEDLGVVEKYIVFDVELRAIFDIRRSRREEIAEVTLGGKKSLPWIVLRGSPEARMPDAGYNVSGAFSTTLCTIAVPARLVRDPRELRVVIAWREVSKDFLGWRIGRVVELREQRVHSYRVEILPKGVSKEEMIATMLAALAKQMAEELGADLARVAELLASKIKAW